MIRHIVHCQDELRSEFMEEMTYLNPDNYDYMDQRDGLRS